MEILLMIRASSNASRVSRISPSLSSTSKIWIFCIRLNFLTYGKIKCRSFIGCGLHPDLPPMPLHDLLTDRQPDTRSRIVAFVMQPLKYNKYLLKELRIYTDPVVLHAEQPEAGLLPQPDMDLRRPVRMIFQRVPNQVHE